MVENKRYNNRLNVESTRKDKVDYTSTASYSLNSLIAQKLRILEHLCQFE